MGFVNYPYLILQISGQTLQVTVARENFWRLNELQIKRSLLFLWTTLFVTMGDFKPFKFASTYIILLPYIENKTIV